MVNLTQGASWLVGIVVSLFLVWALVRYVIPLILPIVLGPQIGTIRACQLKLFLGAFMGSGCFDPTPDRNGKPVPAGQYALSGILYQHCPQREFVDFERNRIYLERTNDTGRDAVPTSLKFVLFALTAAEMGSMAFAISLELSRRELSLSASYGLAAVAALIAGWGFSKLAIPAGQALYRKHQYEFALQGMANARMDGKALDRPRGSVVDYTEAQSVDDDKPSWYQLLNRIGDVKSTGFWLFLLLVTVVFLVLLGFRFGDLMAPSGEAEAATELTEGQWIRSASVFVFIGVIFLVTQAWGVYVGYAHGFAGPGASRAKAQNFEQPTWDQFRAYRAQYLSSCDAVLLEWKMRAGQRVNQGICMNRMSDHFDSD